ncbi:DNA internalization-related competence protein ComEC/Rec2, partial [Paenibacillus larvae]|uniref:DNA internalization-related competence protein ComEC/Rec2 n=1 Tax=Paenibacillus larvae TaxID=1464 RepID=UPI003D2C217E
TEEASSAVGRGGKLHESVQVSVRLLREEEQQTAAAWKRGDRLALHGTLREPGAARNFGGFDYRSHLRQQHIHWLLTLKGTEGVQVSSVPFQWSPVQLLRWNDALRDFLKNRINELFRPEYTGLMKAMLIGWKEEIELEQYGQFSDLGLTHIMAISGLHVGVFIGSLLWVLKRLGWSRELYLLTGILFLPLYMLLTGAAPSTVRAGIMGMVGLYAVRKGIRSDALHAVALVAWIMLVWEPEYLLDIGFQLSFLVTIGLIVLVPRVSTLLPIPAVSLRNTIAMTFVAQAVSFPVTIYYFNQFSLLSWLANALLVPVFSMISFPAGLAALAAGIIWIPLGKIAAAVAEIGNWLAFKTIAFLTMTGGWVTIWPSPSLWWIMAYSALAILLYGAINQWISVKKAASARDAFLRFEAGRFAWFRTSAEALRVVIFCLLSFALLLIIGYGPAFFPRTATVNMIDVGQGDSLLIRTSGGATVLVDGGGAMTFQKPGEAWKTRKNPYEVGKKLLVPLLKKKGIHQLDYVILTHQDTDHSKGLQAVVEEIPVKRFIFNGTFKANADNEKLFSTILEKRIPLIGGTEGMSIPIERSTFLQILYPPARENKPPAEDEEIPLEKDQNAKSVVFLLYLEGTKWLFTGDMGKEEERELLQQPELLPEKEVDVLKVSHHGSKTSTSSEWLDYWKPKLALISAGVNNRYGHPSPDILERLEQRQIPVLRTDLLGEVEVQVKNGNISYRRKM